MRRDDWHGFTSYILENDFVRVVIVPELGAKIASLVDKVAAYEWLAPPTHPVRARHYGDVFIEHDLAGWDEMFPTINVCPAPYAPELQFPDHGEVWALPWTIVEQQAQELILQVEGRSAPYTLRRRATLQHNGLRLDYILHNHGEAAFPFLWAAHPLFRGDEQTRIVLPNTVTQVVNVAAHPHWGEVDRVLDWQAESGLHVIGSADRHDYRKIYAPPEQVMTTACLRQENIAREMRLTWDAEIAPYLGIWIDEGTYSQATTVALEPASGYYDALDQAWQRQRVAVVPARAQVQWWISVELGSLSS